VLGFLGKTINMRSEAGIVSYSLKS